VGWKEGKKKLMVPDVLSVPCLVQLLFCFGLILYCVVLIWFLLLYCFNVLSRFTLDTYLIKKKKKRDCLHLHTRSTFWLKIL